MIKVLFVCLGNICRSPLAEGLFRKLTEDSNYSELISCDSCGTSSYHIGDLPDNRTRINAEKHGLILTHRGRQLSKEDFNEFDYILAMDSSNYENINFAKDKLGKIKAKIFLMRDFDKDDKGEDVPDPYYGGPEGFENVYRILKRSTEGFMEYLKQEHSF